MFHKKKKNMMSNLKTLSISNINESCIINQKKEKELKYKNVKINEDTNGKAIKIGQGGFGKVYKVIKSENEGELKNIVSFAQKHTYVFERDGNIIGQNLKEISNSAYNVNKI